ncbi:cyclase [Curtobacterium sp. 'Ferrero']|uniref:SRPBCC family protein n=1 Tax=Curtobacterium sp. 'Ferrero' TaxID=2033654 RepID=UPI000BD6FEF4|nr:SRPBCC family protein [Curtobacterium sp. 'Ferrero']PCN49038.1 cyclase [Curtobacterium sp. 'Ferrero']
MTVRFRLDTHLDCPPDRAAALSLDVGVHERSLADTGERAVGGVTSGTITLGQTVTFRARHLGIVWRLTSRITVLDAPHRFVDEQVRGPFARFRHEHRFAAAGAGTRMVDVVEFAAPLGPLGRIAEMLVLDRYLRHIIARRNTVLVAEAGGSEHAPAG